MKKIAVVLLVFCFLILIGTIVFRFTVMPSYLSSFQQGQVEKVSEAEKIKDTIRVAGDNYLGYWFITSHEFKYRLGQKGYAIAWFNDGGNYADRHQKFGEGKYDMMVLPVNSYLFHGKPDYPGLIVAALSDSKGADNIVGYQENITGGTERQVRINDLNNPALRIGVTPDSPSSFLLDVATVYFDLDKIKGGQGRVETNGSADAYQKLAEKDPQKRQVDVAVVWEPNVSQALQIPGVVSIFGSDQISGMIIDVFVVRDNVLKDKPEMVEAFFEAYFETLSYYSTNREEMIQEMAKTTVFKTEEMIKKALERIAWFDLKTNYEEWFSLGGTSTQTEKKEKIVRTIIQVRDVMQEIGELKTDPLQGNPYRIINSKILERIYGKAIPEISRIGAVLPTVTAFPALSGIDWAKLRSIGTLKVSPITFDASTSRLTLEGAQVIDEAATLLIYNFPQYRVLIKGHTAPSGDEAANVALSQERADLVKNYLLQTHGIDPNRIKTVGMGSSEPLPRERNEAERTWRNRLARVEFILLEEKVR